MSFDDGEFRVLKFRSGDGAVPRRLDECVATMALFEDAVFALPVDREVDFRSEPAMFDEVDNKKVPDDIFPVCDLTPWL